MSRTVLDASALLAVLLEERGAERVLTALTRATISAVNLAEVASRLAALNSNAREALEAVEAFSIHVEAFDEEQAIRVGELRTRTVSQGLSLGDRACLALAERDGSALLTADRAFAAVQTVARVELIR